MHFPRWNRTADELCVQHPADVVWAVQMSTVEFHPWNSRRFDVERPDEWRIDLDPMPEATFADVRRVAHLAHEVLDELGAGRLAEDVRRQGHPHLRAHPADPRVRRRPAGGAGLRPRGRAPGRRTRRPHVVAQGPRSGDGVRRLQPERPRSHDPLRRTRSAASRRRSCRRRSAGTRSTTPNRRTSRSPRCRSASPNWAISTKASTTAVFAIDELLEWAERDARAGVARWSRSRTESPTATDAAVSATGMTSTTLRFLRSPNLTEPSTSENSVSSPPMPTLRAGVDLGAALADDDRAGSDLRAVEDLHAEALGVGVTTVAGRPATFRLGHLCVPLARYLSSGRSW